MTQLKSINVSKGIARNRELARTDPDEIKENIPSSIDVQRILLTFNSPKIPESLKVCYLNIPVSQFELFTML